MTAVHARVQRRSASLTETDVIYLIRHAHAGDKHRWTGPDHKRPISPTGRREAAGLIQLLESRPLNAIVSSPARRCRQTVQPIAAHRGIPIDLDERLNVEATADDLIKFLLEWDRTAGHVALCSHGEVIGQALGVLRDEGTPIGEQAQWAKGSVWLLGIASSQGVEATYLPPVRVDRPLADHAGT